VTKAQLDAMQRAAEKRLREFINRSVGQHLRAMKKGWQ
jgi:hypothetical protein